MAPQLYITMYKEQFSSPGRVTRTQLRPTSAHRRNNPQPHAVGCTALTINMVTITGLSLFRF